MRTYGFTPPSRGLFGFDPFDVFAPLAGPDSAPAYNVEQAGEDHFRIALAVAGYGDEDLEIRQKEDVVTVTGTARETGTDVAYLHRGISGQGFERRFVLGHNVRVTGANLENGILRIDLVREIPEAERPRRIPIGGAPQIEEKAA